MNIVNAIKHSLRTLFPDNLKRCIKRLRCKNLIKSTYKHYLEISAYRYMLKNLYNFSINGCMILQLNKDNISYEEYLLDLCSDRNNLFMNNCEKTYLSLVFSYINRIKIENDFSTILKENEN